MLLATNNSSLPLLNMCTPIITNQETILCTWRCFILFAFKRCYNLPRLFNRNLLSTSIFGKYSIRCWAFLMYIASHDDIFIFILSPLILNCLKVSSGQFLPTTWNPIWWIICAEVILLYLFLLLSMTDNYLFFSLFFHGNYSDHFYKLKFLGTVSPLQIENWMATLIVKLVGDHFI